MKGLELTLAIGSLKGKSTEFGGILLFINIRKNLFGQFMTLVDSNEKYFEG